MNINFVSCYLTEFISFSSFLVESLGFPMYNIMASEKKIYFFLSNFDDFYFLFCLIAMARTSITTLNERGESR